ncbi:MAG TPA: hypothetical protein VIM73_17380, partial [Polyangiaceae bacterium]
MRPATISGVMIRASFWSAVAVLPLLVGCAHETADASYPQAAGAGWVVPASYCWPPMVVAPAPSAASSNGPKSAAAKIAPASAAVKTESVSPSSAFAKMGGAPRPRTRNELRSVLPPSAACLAELAQRGVPFHALDHELGVKTPIVVDGPITGVRYYTGANGPLIADCRLVLALSLVGPELVRYGVSDVRFSGAYVYRLSNKGRVSLHAYGLALDMHGFTRNG